MNAFRALLVSMLLVVMVYTALVIGAHGWGLFPVFFGDIQAMGWPGQFNLDFTCLLILSGVWVAWRNHFTPAGLALGAIALVGGTPFLACYLLYASAQAKGDVKTLLLGPKRAAA